MGHPKVRFLCLSADPYSDRYFGCSSLGLQNKRPSCKGKHHHSSCPTYLFLSFGIQVQFWTFTLVVLFYMQMIHKIEKDWAEYRTKCFLFYVVINMLFLLGFLGTIMYCNIERSLLVLPSLNYFIPKVNEQWISAASTFFIAIMYLVLALLLTFFGWRLVYLIMTTTVQVLTLLFSHSHPPKVPFLKSKSRVIVLTIILVLTFISRSIRDLLAGFKIGNISLSDPMVSSSNFAFLFCRTCLLKYKSECF